MAMTTPSRRWRRNIARGALLLGLALIIWLPAGILNLAPFVFALPGESNLRVHAAAAVACLMVAAWGFWND